MLSKEKFRSFVKVQLGGKYNMYTESVKASEEAGLQYTDYRDIIENYIKYDKLYPEVRKEEEQKLMKELLKHKS